jgi:hypothetical protein
MAKMNAMQMMAAAANDNAINDLLDVFGAPDEDSDVNAMRPQTVSAMLGAVRLLWVIACLSNRVR